MPTCTYLERCSLRHSIAMKAALGVWRSFYCEGAFERCERYKLATAGVDVPARLLPNGKLLDGHEATLAAAVKRAG